MKLRDHRLMTRISGVCAWPPLWVDTRGPGHKKPRGEVGYLKRVETHAAIANGLFLWTEYEGQTYIGMMHFDDLAFCNEIARVLQHHLGVPISDIGDIDLS